ncbi:low molecular weight protein-tyrosine-phosphatase [uncultured Litoreibacter sp.]|uniref:low molecular weight protein-tyrosine-phosphatase n=1 Tax=uncultured Litoreibacter sp. TaxID=1392394 RepID=UPI00262F66EA|nr:low molecular weight protein-tyrosine-phosphatase [uncultured Litoreibacter sp.]
MTDRILFVCLGNICRSPLAEGVLRRRAEEAGLDLFVDSAGIGDWHVGDPPDARAMVAARKHGFEISAQRARQFSSEDFSRFCYILVMDHDNMTEVEARRLPDDEAKVDMLTKFGSGTQGEDIADPYYSGKFDPVIAKIEDCVAGLIAYLKDEQDRSASDANTL